MRRLVLFLLLASCHEQSVGSVAPPKPVHVVAPPSASASSAPPTPSASTSAGAAVSPIVAREAIGPFPSVSALCAQIVAGCPPKARCGCHPGTKSFAAAAPYSHVTTVGVDAELVGFTVIRPVVRTAAGFWMAIDGLEAVSIATTDTATEIAVSLDDVDVDDTVPGGEREIVLHLSTAGSMEVYADPSKATGKKTPTSHDAWTIVCGFGATGALACTAPFTGGARTVQLP